MRCSPAYYIFNISTGILAGLTLGAGVWATQNVFDAMVDLASGQQTYKAAIFAIGIFILLLLAREIFNSMVNYQIEVIGERMTGFMNKELSLKTAKLDPILFEDPNMLDEINKAKEAVPIAFWIATVLVIALTIYLPYFLFIAIYLYALNPILVWIILFAFLPKFIALFLRTRLYAQLEDTSAPLRREFQSYEDAIVDRSYFKETRILGAFKFFKTKYLNSVKLLNHETWKIDAKSATIELFMSFLTSLGYLAILSVLFISLRDSLITVGAFAAVFGSISVLIQLVDELVSRHFTQASSELGKINSLMNFLDLPEKFVNDIPINWQGDIELKDVSFTYPNSSKESISNISLTIKSGETVAIVGVNGAGKSTITKILMGLYEPTTGQVIVDGRCTKGIKPHQLFKDVSAVFQNYQRYQLTLKENIEISDVDLNDDIVKTMEKAGVEWDARCYPDGVETILSREFDGVDLSGGQWQRIAIARGLYRHHDLIVLDEPTAAIDPLEENRLYEKFAEISKNKTSIIVTHRLGSTQIADKIIVLDDGKLIEEGTHQQLLANKGHYAKMYESQASWYMAD